MITIKDIAKNLNVSYSTVSRCLNNDKTVSEKTKKRVLEEAKRLNFIPNANARNLAKRCTNRIGIIFSDDYIEELYRWFFGEIEKHAVRKIQQEGFDYIIQSNYDYNGTSNILKLVKTQLVDGLLIASKYVKKEDVEYLDSINFPYVFLYFEPDFQIDNLNNYICDDNKYGGYLATKYLIDRGHEKIITITTKHEKMKLYHERTKGYVQAMEESNLQTNILYRDTMGFLGHEKFIEDNINAFKENTAAFIQQDLAALGFIKALEKNHNMFIPKDLSVIGYNNIDMIKYLDIDLTTIHDPRKNVIYKSISELSLKIHDKKYRYNTNTALPEIVERSTVERLSKK